MFWLNVALVHFNRQNEVDKIIDSDFSLLKTTRKKNFELPEKSMHFLLIPQ